MRITRLLCLLCCFIFTWTSAASAKQKSSAEITKELITCLEEGERKAKAELDELDSDDPVKTQAARVSVASFTRALDSVRGLQLLLESSSLESVSQSLSRMTHNRQALPSECADLQLELSRAIERERQARVDAFEAELGAFRDEVGDALMSAKAPGDLDALFVELEDLKERATQYRSSNSQFQNTTNNLTRIVTGWQDYLNYLVIGDQKQAESSLRNLNQSLTATPVVPRSKVLQMQNELKRGAQAAKLALENGGSSAPSVPYSVQAVLKEIKEIGDLAPAYEKLDVLRQYREVRSAAESQQNNIRHLLNALKLMDDGNPLLGISALQNAGVSGSSSDRFWFEPMRMELRQYALYRLIPEAYRVGPEKTSMESLVQQAAKQMASAKDWTGVWELLKIVKVCYSNSNVRSTFPSLDNDILSLERYIYAVRLEETGQLDAALSSYNLVLSKTGFYGPYEAAQRAIVALREGRADELLADQKRIAEKPVPPISSDPRSRYYASRNASNLREQLNSPEIKSLLDQVVAQQMAVYLEREAKAKIKASEAPQAKAQVPEAPQSDSK